MNEIKGPNYVIPEGTTILSAEMYTEHNRKHEQNVTADESACTMIEEGETRVGKCAGEYTHCIARLINYPGHMTVPYAHNAQQGYQLAVRCRSDVIDATYYSNQILICAPYVRCNAAP